MNKLAQLEIALHSDVITTAMSKLAKLAEGDGWEDYAIPAAGVAGGVGLGHMRPDLAERLPNLGISSAANDARKSLLNLRLQSLLSQMESSGDVGALEKALNGYPEIALARKIRALKNEIAAAPALAASTKRMGRLGKAGLLGGGLALGGAGLYNLLGE